MIGKKINKYFLSIIILFLGISLQNSSLLGQQTQSKINYDAGIALAQKLAIEGKYEVSRLVCLRILTDAPEYVDGYLIIGNTYAWDKQFEVARLFYNKVFEFENGNMNAFSQLISLELWEGFPEKAISIANAALEFEQDNATILYKKARAHVMLNELSEAKEALYIILFNDPTNSEALQLYQKVLNGVPIKVLINRQVVVDLSTVDSLFLLAQNLAFSENFSKALDVLDYILLNEPSYLQANVLKAQVHAWNREYDIAREIVRKINRPEIKFRPAVLTAIDIELWSENYHEAIVLCDSLGLKYFTDDHEVLFRKAEAHMKLHEYYLAKRIIFFMMYESPGDIRGLQYYNELVDSEELYERDYLGDVQSDRNKHGFDKDSLLAIARDLAFNRKYIEAHAICYDVVNLYPDDYDALYLLGVTNAWMERFDEARSIFNRIFQTSFDSPELISSMVDLEMWDHQDEEAMHMVDYGLEVYPNDKSLLLKKAAIHQRMNRSDLAAEIFQNLLLRYPDDKKLQKSYFARKGLVQLNAVGAGYTFNTYSIPVVRSWHMLTSSYYHTNDIGSFIGKVNTGYVADDTTGFMEGGGIQFEIDAYPVFHDKKRYFFLSYGFSPGNIFARHRFGAHIYQDISRGWEVSAGFNYSFYRNSVDTTHVVVLRAGINKYWDYFMLGMGVGFSPSFGKWSQGYTAIARKYLQRPDNWIQIAVSAGIYPENPFYYLGDPLGRTAGLLQAYSINSSFRYLINPRWIGQLSFGYQRQEYFANFMRNSWSFNLSMIYLFEEAF